MKKTFGRRSVRDVLPTRCRHVSDKKESRFNNKTTEQSDLDYVFLQMFHKQGTDILELSNRRGFMMY